MKVAAKKKCQIDILKNCSEVYIANEEMDSVIMLCIFNNKCKNVLIKQSILIDKKTFLLTVISFTSKIFKFYDYTKIISNFFSINLISRLSFLLR